MLINRLINDFIWMHFVSVAKTKSKPSVKKTFDRVKLRVAAESFSGNGEN